MASSLPCTMTPFLVSDSLIHNVNKVPACKIDSSSDSPVCLTSIPLSTSALEMNISSSLSLVSHALNVAVQQVMNSDAALNSVIIPETRTSQSHFHIACQLKGRHRTIKVAAMVDSGATLSRSRPWWVLHGAGLCSLSIRIGLSHRCIMGLVSQSGGLAYLSRLLVLCCCVMSRHSPRPSFDAWGCTSTLSCYLID